MVDVKQIFRQLGDVTTNAVADPTALTPWELRNGIWYKREDYHRNRYGVNGAKYRVCRHLMVQAALEGYDHVVSAQSVLSPQSAICATLAEELGMRCTIVLGASKPETAVRHPSVRIAVQAGAELDTTCRVAYNGVIQPYAKKLSESLGAWQLPYAISPPADASEKALQAFLAVGGAQVANLPPEVETLVVPFGSGNTTAGILYGLASMPESLGRVVLVGVGPDRTDWLWDRLGSVGVDRDKFPFEIVHVPLHGWFADYGDSMKETVDEITMHPTYEGKVVRFLNSAEPDYWTSRDGSTGFWIVGGPM